MISDTEAGTRQALEQDLKLASERTAQIDAVEKKIAAEEAEGQRLAAVMSATHAEIAKLKADHEAVSARTHDALIDGTDTDPVAAAKAIQESDALLAIHIGKLKRITEHRLLNQRIKILTAQKERAVLVLDRAGIESRIHSAKLLLAILPAGEIGGDLSVKSEIGMRLAHEESQASYNLEAANAALEAELASQQKIKDARTNVGPVSYQNPS